MNAPWAPPNADEGFYVTIKRGSRTGALLGPFVTHEDALGQVDTGRELAIELDRFAAFDLFGTAKIIRNKTPELPSGRLNQLWEERHARAES